MQSDNEKCKEKAWTRWTSEYLKARCEQHNLNHQSHGTQISNGDVVLIKGDKKNRGKWYIGIVQRINNRKDENIRSAKLRYKKTIWNEQYDIHIQWN